MQRKCLEIILRILSPAGVIIPWSAITLFAISISKGALPSCTSADAVDPKSTIVDSQRELSRNADSEIGPAGVHVRSPTLARFSDLVSEG